MDRFQRLFLIVDSHDEHSTTRLARAAGIDVMQCHPAELSVLPLRQALVGYPFYTDMPGRKGFSTQLLAISKQAPLFIFSADRSMIDPNRAIRAGFRGVIYRDEQAERIKMALQTMMSGQLYYARNVMSEALDQAYQSKHQHWQQPERPQHDVLTRKENLIAQHIADGMSNKEIAENLQISANTVKVHVSAIFKKTSCKNRIQLSRWLQGK
ncbi:response regulator transcription factor [Arsukibacterium sp.]|uniref:response regulator transcription factor n=1 Tax=Arsukibacterium sp. TaxID=1977258 RepID=UPI002FD88449